MHLEQIQKGKVKKPHLILLYGPDGVGKTTFGASFPDPVFIGNEDGSSSLDAARFHVPKSWEIFLEQLKELCTGEHKFKSVIVDSLDWLEILLHKKICEDNQVKSIEQVGGGFGKGYVEAFTHWQTLKSALDYLREKRQMNVILLAHSEVIAFNDPTTQTTYDRYQIKLNKKAAAFFREYVDFLFFANFDVYTKKVSGKERAFGHGARVIYTERRPGFDAKSRADLPVTIPLSYTDFEKNLNKRTLDDVKKDIEEELKEFDDADFVKLVNETVEKSKGHMATLEEVLNRLRVKKNEKAEEVTIETN